MAGWEVNVSAGISILLILLMRKVFLHRTPKWLYVWCWRFLLIRLAVPFALFTEVKPSTVFAYEAEVFARVDTVLTGDHKHTFWLVLWGAGACFCMAVYLKNGFDSYRALRESLPVENPFYGRLVRKLTGKEIPVLYSDRVSTPLTYGVFLPKIILPGRSVMEKMNEEEIRYILLHELGHIKSQDNFWKLVSGILVCVYWFNPFVWILYKALGRDMELSCDEGVLRCMEGDKRGAYALCLIKYQELKAGGIAAGSGFFRKKIEERVVAIMTYKKKKYLLISAAGLAFLAAGFTFFVPQVKVKASPEVLQVQTQTEGNAAEAVTETEAKTLSERVEQVKRGELTGKDAEAVEKELHEENYRIIAAYEAGR